MTARRIKSESLENLKRVVDSKDDNVEIVGDMGIVMADAYAESIKNAEHVETVKNELTTKADDIKTENPSTGKEVKNEFTAKLVLDEALEDFESPVEPTKKTKVYDDNKFDTYWDMDMFDFIYELVSISDERRKPIDPLGRPHARFSVTGRDKYVGLTAEQQKIEKKREKEFIENGGDINQIGASQVASAGDYIEVYAHDLFRFNDIQEICKIYKFETRGPEETYKMKRNRFMMAAKDEWITYPYVFRIYIPCDDNGYPMMMEDYFATLGLTLEDVMNAEFCEQYRKIEATIKKEAEAMLAKKARADAKNKKEAQRKSTEDLRDRINAAASQLVATEMKNDEPVVSLIHTAVDKLFDIVYDKSSGYYDMEIVGPSEEAAIKLIEAAKRFVKSALRQNNILFTPDFVDSEFAAELE